MSSYYWHLRSIVEVFCLVQFCQIDIPHSSTLPQLYFTAGIWFSTVANFSWQQLIKVPSSVANKRMIHHGKMSWLLLLYLIVPGSSTLGTLIYRSIQCLPTKGKGVVCKQHYIHCDILGWGAETAPGRLTLQCSAFFCCTEYILTVIPIP